jgi:MFS superfamily sulfate permease-like transporter
VHSGFFCLETVDCRVRPNPVEPTNRWQDILAGLSIAGLLLPEAVAYSSIAALAPQAGVIAFAGLLCYGLFGTSRFAIVSATSSSAAVLAAATATMANGDPQLRATLAVGLVLVTGGLFLLAGIFRFGSVTSVYRQTGVARVCLRPGADHHPQAGRQCGRVHLTDANLVRFAPQLLAQLPQWNWPAAGVAAVALVLLLLFSRFPRVPGGLLVVVIGIAAGQWLNLSAYGVKMIGLIDLSLEVPNLPVLPFADWLRWAKWRLPW